MSPNENRPITGLLKNADDNLDQEVRNKDTQV